MREDGAICISGPCKDRTGEQYYLLRLLIHLGRPGPQFQSAWELQERIESIYETASKFDILFSDYSKGDADLFKAQFINPRGAWFSVEGAQSGKEVGVMYLSELNPYWDANAHISFWDSVLPGREPVIWDAIEWVMDTYYLPRISAEVPAYQRNFRRFVEHLGFKEEGLKRQAGLREGTRQDHVLYGMLPEDLKEARNGKHND